jgi:hypothetical protein
LIQKEKAKKLLLFKKHRAIMRKINIFMVEVCRRSYAAEGVTLSGFPKGKGTANGHNFGEAH